MNNKFLIPIIIIAVFIAGIVYFSFKRISMTSVEIPSTTTESITKIKNPTVSNSANDLAGSNNLESIGLWWDRDEHTTEYILFRSDVISGPFAEIGRVPAGLDRRTNAEDITQDAKVKTLCYKIEARDAAGKTVRIYEPICIPKWKN